LCGVVPGEQARVDGGLGCRGLWRGGLGQTSLRGLAQPDAGGQQAVDQGLGLQGAEEFGAVVQVQAEVVACIVEVEEKLIE